MAAFGRTAALGVRVALNVIAALLSTAAVSATPAAAQTPQPALRFLSPVTIDPATAPGRLGTVVSISCPTTALCVAVDDAGRALTSTDPAAATPTWSAPTLIDPAQLLAAVSCPSASLCVALNGDGFAFTTTDPAARTPIWSGPKLVDPPPTGPPYFGGLQIALSCPSTALCVAVDAHGFASVSTDPGAAAPTWSAPTQIDPAAGASTVDGLSCASASLCVAVNATGDAVLTTDPGSPAPAWRAADADGATALTGVSCPTTAICMAVDAAGRAVVSTDPAAPAPTWFPAAAIDRSASAITSVACVATTLCVALDGAGVAFVTTDPAVASPTWRAPVTLGADAVSCAAPALCTAVGYHVAAALTDASAAAPTWHAIRGFDGVGTTLTDLTCASAAQCVAIDTAGRAVVLRSPQSSKPTIVATPASSPLLYYGRDSVEAVACTSQTRCLAIANAGADALSLDPSVKAPAWAALTPTWSAPTGYLTGEATALTCPSATLCAVSEAGASVFGSRRAAIARARGAHAGSARGRAAAAGTQIDEVAGAGVSCPSTALCVAVNYQGQAVVSTDPTAATPTWTATPVIDSPSVALAGEPAPGYLTAVSCPTTTLCIAVDSAGNVTVSTDPASATAAWSAPRPIDADLPPPCPTFVGTAVAAQATMAGAPECGVVLTDVACPSASRCVAVDTDGDALVSTDPGSATATWTVTRIDTLAPLVAVSCPSISLCIAVDTAGDAVIAAPSATGSRLRRM